MKTYEVIYMPEDAVCWEQVASLELENAQWLDSPHIHASAKVCYNENALHVRLQAVEQDILCRYNGLTDEVCEDSCLEFFFSPEADGRYFNLECNPNGALYFGIGYGRDAHLRLIHGELGKMLQVTPFSTEDGWGTEITIPVKLMRILYPGLTLSAGKVIPANFYKCGEDTKVPHYLTWNTVESAEPDFHLPQFFGRLILK